MQNDVLKNEIAPWQEKGRWYHAHVTEAGIDADNTDQFLLENNNLLITTTSSYFTLNKGTLIDYKIVYNKRLITAAASGTLAYRIYTSGAIGGQHLPLNNFTELDADYYLFVK